jgi:hypothetical protein
MMFTYPGFQLIWTVLGIGIIYLILRSLTARDYGTTMKDIFIFIITFSLIMFYYWVSGGHFIRSGELGLVVGLGSLFSLLAVVLMPVSLNFKKPKDK